MGAPRICVAGIDVATNRHVRPTTPATDPITRDLLEDHGGPFALGAVVELGAVRPNPRPPETEDHVFATAAATGVAHLTDDEYLQLVESVATDDLEAIFGPDLERRGRSFAIEEGRGMASLGVLRIQETPELLVDDWGKLRLRLNDVAPPAHLGVTDLRFVGADHSTLKRDVVDDVRGRMQRGVGVLLMVGLARAWRAAGDDRERHWLQVNGICLEDRPLG
jgi:hypothetical protein